MSSINGYIPISQVLLGKRKREQKKASKAVVETSQKVVEAAKTIETQKSPTKPLAEIQFSSWKEISVSSSASTVPLEESEKENLKPDFSEISLSPSITEPAPSPHKTPVKKAKPEASFESPDLKSPMGYHFSSYFDSPNGQVNKMVKKFKGKSTHTLATPTAKKDASLIKEHYSAIKISEELSLPSPDKATIKMIEKDRFTVARQGKEREFGVHSQIDANGEPRKRLYPAKGSGCISLSGPELFDQFQAFKSQRGSEQPSSFFEYVSNSLQAKNKTV